MDGFFISSANIRLTKMLAYLEKNGVKSHKLLPSQTFAVIFLNDGKKLWLLTPLFLKYASIFVNLIFVDKIKNPLFEEVNLSVASLTLSGQYLFIIVYSMSL